MTFPELLVDPEEALGQAVGFSKGTKISPFQSRLVITLLERHPSVFKRKGGISPPFAAQRG